MRLFDEALAKGELRPDTAQSEAVRRLGELAKALRKKRGFSLFRKPDLASKGLYIWGDVGRGKTMLMDFFFEDVAIAKKRRAHFNRFMMDVHARIHAERQRAGSSDPIPVVAKALAEEARLLCFDEFQVTDVADAMILGRLFDRLFAAILLILDRERAYPCRQIGCGGLVGSTGEM